jgi:integrase
MPDYSLVRIGTSPNWYIQWFEDGHSRRASARTADRDQAEQVLAAFRLVRSEQPVEDMTIAQCLEWYWDSYAKNLMRPDSADLAIRYLRPFFGATLASSLTRTKQQAYIDHRRLVGAGDESIRRDLSVLSAALNRAEKFNKLTRAPPMMSLTPAPARERFLSRKEVARLWRRLRGPRSAHVLLFCRLALYTGARTSAILELTWDRVDFANGRIDYRVPGRPQTKKRRVVAPMTPMLERMLRHAKKRSRSRHVISWAGEKIDRVAKAAIAHAEAVGIEGFSPHVLRHTFASWAVQNDVSIYIVGKALGQTIASTTERYAKLAPNDVRDAMAAMRRKKRKDSAS